MQLDEDDLYDYEQDSYDEDAVISEVISALKPVRISEQDAEVALDKSDWDVPAAIASLKKQHQPKKQAQKPAPKPASKPDGKLSALQMLAQQRTSQQPPAEAPRQAPSLAQLAAQRRAQAEKPKLGSSALEKLMSRKESTSASAGLAALKKRAEKQENTPSPSAEPPVDSAIASKPWTPAISYEHSNKVSLKPPSGFGALIGTSGLPFFTNAETNTFVAQKDVKKAFSGPSPDDVVLSAQAQGFGTKSNAKPLAKSEGPAATAPADLPSGSKSTAKQKTVQPKSDAQKSELAAKLANMKLKPSCSFVVIGHVDAGKSTLMGRLLLDTGALSQKIVSKYEHESSKVGKSSFWLAWALDATKEERERGVTVDVGEASFETESTRFTVLDAPGHRDYVPNMIAGVAQADVAVLVVDSDTNAFESGFSLDGQTKEHAVLARSLGVDRVVVAVNKMDTQNWSEDRFEDITAQLTEFLGKKVGFDTSKVLFVPTSGITGVNVVHKGGPDWYKGQSLVSILEHFAAMNTQSPDPANEPVRFLVSNAFVEPFQSTITTTGRVLSGVIEKGDVLELVALSRQATVKNIAGDAEFLGSRDVGEMKLQLDSNGSSEEDSVAVRPGDVMASPNAGLVPSKHFVAKIQLFDIPRPVLPGTKLAFHMGRVDDTVKVVKLIESLSKTQARKIRHLGKGTAARVELELGNATVLTPPSVCKDLGRFVLRLNGATIGGGVVDSLLS